MCACVFARVHVSVCVSLARWAAGPRQPLVVTSAGRSARAPVRPKTLCFAFVISRCSGFLDSWIPGFRLLGTYWFARYEEELLAWWADHCELLEGPCNRRGLGICAWLGWQAEAGEQICDARPKNCNIDWILEMCAHCLEISHKNRLISHTNDAYSKLNEFLLKTKRILGSTKWIKER